MKGMVFTGDEGVRYQHIDDPTVQDSKGAIVKVSHCSICGSDTQFYHGINNASADTHFCIGHEAIGEIVEVGSDVKSARPGDKVMLSGLTSEPCGKCANCWAGRPFYCHKQVLGIYGTGLAMPGTQAEAVHVPNADKNATLIPDGVSNEQALLLTDTLPTAFFGCDNADIRPGSRAAIVGLGPIGLMAVELAFVFGATEVFAIDPVAYRRDKAAAMGAISLHPEEALEAIAESTDGEMVHSVIDAAGRSSSIELAANIAANRGVISCVGISHEPTVSFPQILSVVKSLTFRSALTYVPMTWPRLIPLLQHDTISPQNVFSHRLPLSEGERAYQLFCEREDSALKIILDTAS